MAVPTELYGHRLTYKRRRYGTTTYTWVTLHVEGEEITLGDPWPCIVPKSSEVEHAVKRTLALRKGKKNADILLRQLREAHRP